MAQEKRRAADWLDAFFKYTEGRPTTKLFRKWVGISIIAGALERRTWVHSLGMDLYPNLFVVLTSPPGTGKTVLTSIAQELWQDMPELYMAPSSVSRASLIDALRDANRHIVMPQHNPPVMNFNSLMIVLNELGTFLPAYENEFITTLTDLYDNKRYGERKRTKDLNFGIEKPQINILAGTQPSYLVNLLPEGAWDQGFTSRTIFVYSGETFLADDLFADLAPRTKEYADILHDLKLITKLYGKITFEPDAAKAITDWYRSKGDPAPDHPKLTYYNARRTAHLLKLCQVATVSEGDTLVVTKAQLARALSWLLEAERVMPEIFKSMAQGGDSKVIEDTWHYAYTIHIRDKTLLTEQRIIEYIAARTPAHNVQRIFDLMIKLRLLEKELDEYRPRPWQRK